MTEKVFQCCYTNASQEVGGRLSSGWQAVAVSPGLPVEAYNACVNLQNVNSAIQGNMTDERGNVLNLFEVVGDGNFLYMIRTQYGLLDRLGRANMFSHAYIFPWKDEAVLADPNTFLTIDNANFKDNEAEAAEMAQNLVRTEPLDVGRALNIAGMDKAAYIALIQCVYAQMSERKTSKTLYVQYDGTDAQLRAIIHCIYFGVPYYMRRHLSAASATVGGASAKSLIFSESAKEYDAYVVPQTGENSIISSRTEKRILRQGFVDFTARNLGQIDANAYFAELENTAVQLGDSGASSETILRIAHQLMCDNDIAGFDNGELDSRLGAALRSRSRGSALMERHIADLLTEVCKRDMLLADESETDLTERLNNAETEELAKAGELYNVRRFSMLPAGEAAQRLSRMDEAMFESYSRIMARDAKGMEILDCYYGEVCLGGSDVTWEYLSKVWDASSCLEQRPKTEDRAEELAWGMYCGELNTVSEGSGIGVYNAYMGFMSSMLDADEITGCATAAKEEYWERMTFGGFYFDARAVEEYRFFALERNATCRMMSDYLRAVQSYAHEGPEVFLAMVNGFFAAYGRAMDDAQRGAAFQKLLAEAEPLAAGEEPYLSRWSRLAVMIQEKDLFRQVMDIRAALCNGDYLYLLRIYKPTAAILRAQVSDAALTVLNGLVFDVCADADRVERHVPLDVWLAIGEIRGGNVFSVFDKINPAILSCPPEFVIDESALFRRREFIRGAEEYIRNKGREAKAVKRWLDALKQVARRERKEERKERGEGGLLERGISMLSKFAPQEDKGNGESAGEAADDGAQKDGLFKHR